MSESPQTIIALAQQWLRTLAAKGARPKTVQAYSVALRSLTRFLVQRQVTNAQEVTAEDLSAYQLALVKRGLAPASQDLYLRSARSFFRWLEVKHRIFQSPCSGMRCQPVPLKLQPVPSEEEVAELLAGPDPTTPIGARDRTLLELAYATGARREELCQLQVHDLDLEHATVRLAGKGGRERVVPVGRTAGAWVRRYLTEARPVLLQGGTSTALWIDLHGRPLGYYAFAQVVRRYAQSAQITLTPHSLRRACATHMLQRGAQPAQLEQLLGHATAKTLSRYLRLDVPDLKNVHARSRPGQ